MTAKFRMSLDVNESARQIIDELAESDGITYSELFRRALSAYKSLKDYRKAGEEPVLMKDGVVVAKLAWL